jgi:glycosyltransferase involved in cell wall biosynthesis
MPPEADVCLIVEGGYPYVVGGVGSWLDALVRASPDFTFHIVAITISSQPKQRKYEIPGNVVGLTDILLDICPAGRSPRSKEQRLIQRGVELLQAVVGGCPGGSFQALVDLVRETGFGEAGLFDSRPAWLALQQVYQELLPTGPLLEFFWSWRFLARSILSIISTKVPKARVFHAVATGYAGLFGAYARLVTGCPFILTEHGIYTNERRIELGVADWIFDSGANGFDVAGEITELRDLWLAAFTNLSRISYTFADVITTQYRANQDYQRSDGAPDNKLRIIQNGIDVNLYAGLERDTGPRPPTVLMIGRIVPIKDTRTFIMAVSLLRQRVPDVVAILIGPEDEDTEYAAGCRSLVAQLGIESSVRFLGRVPDVKEYLRQADVIALTSISEAQPIALLEAAATGLPAVTTDVGSCREIIEGFDDDPVRGRGGYVVEACNPQGIANALGDILLDQELRLEMGQVMQRRIGHLYDKERIRRIYEDLYLELGAKSATVPEAVR